MKRSPRFKLPSLGRHILRLAPALLIAAAGPLAAAATTSDGLSAALGKALFKRNWVPAPSSTKANDGLGPLFNARSCAQCHRAATAGVIALDDGGVLAERGAVVRLSGLNGAGDAHYGAQLQTRAVPNFEAEGKVRITWESEDVTLPDGTVVALRKPALHLRDLSDGPIDTHTSASLALAPSLEVAARIAEVDASALTAAGGSGRLMRAADGRPAIFGRKASEADIATAAATAFSRDLGMSTKLFPAPSGDCTALQQACREAPSGAEPGGVEIGDEILQALVAYVEALPRPTAPDASDTQGHAAFDGAQCAGCHTPELKGRQGAPVALYSDLRLHDLGEALAGPAEPEGAGPREWRTAPLLGLKDRLSAGATLLHDGRARTVEEAILWHGGAAEPARDRYAQLPKGEREALIRFLMSK